MGSEIKKLELISWIAAINDQGILEKLYAVKESLQSKKTNSSKTSNEEAIELLKKITNAYVSSSEPDLNIAQIFIDRTKTNGRDIDFN